MPFCSQGAISSARRSAKAEVRGANPRESASFQAPVPQQLQGEFRKLVFVGASPTRGSSFKSGSWCNSSISPCEGDGPGANPGFLTSLEKENARRALKEIGLSASGFCSESNPSPGTKISTPEFGCELFVAQGNDGTFCGGGNGTLFTAVHQGR